MFVPIGSNSGESYQVQRSLRFRASASAWGYRNITDTPADTNNKRKTYSMWCKRSALGSVQELVSNYISSVNFWGFYFSSDDRLCFYAIEGGTAQASKFSAAVFRDVTAHMHIMLVTDTANVTAEDRVQLYVNGARVTSWNTNTTPALNAVTAAAFIAPASGTWFLNIGRQADATNYFDGYLADVVGVDGQALTPSSFGEFDSSGNWRPKAYTGTYGTNGFRLDFSDPTSLTTLMLDSSGNGNNWTANNISLTAGVTYDSMIDVPLGAGGQERGNYAVMNPLDVSPTEGNGRAVFSNGALTLVGGNQFARGWSIPSSGQWYWEITLVDFYAGAPPDIWGSHGVSSATFANLTGVHLWANTLGGILQDGTQVQTFSTWSNNDIIGFAYDAAARSMSVYLNGTQLGTSVTANATDKYVYSYLNGTADTSAVTYNLGQRPFAYTPPTGFKALHTGSLTNTTPIASGSFTGNLSADGPCIWCNGTPETLTINGNAVTWGTHADKLATGFKIRTASSSYNSSGTNTWTATFPSPSSQAAFKYQNAKGNP